MFLQKVTEVGSPFDGLKFWRRFDHLQDEWAFSPWLDALWTKFGDQLDDKIEHQHFARQIIRIPRGPDFGGEVCNPRRLGQLFLNLAQLRSPEMWQQLKTEFPKLATEFEDHWDTLMDPTLYVREKTLIRFDEAIRT